MEDVSGTLYIACGSKTNRYLVLALWLKCELGIKSCNTINLLKR